MSEPITAVVASNQARPGRKLQHVVESQQFTVPLLMELFDRSRGMERIVGLLVGKSAHCDVVLEAAGQKKAPRRAGLCRNNGAGLKPWPRSRYDGSWRL